MRRISLLFLLLVVLGIAVFLSLHFWPFSVIDTFPNGALQDYLSHDTAAVVVFDLKDLRDRGLLEKPLGKSMREALTKEELEVPFALLGVDPAQDVDVVRMAFSEGDYSSPLVLLRGRFDRTRFAIGTGQLEESKQDGFRLYRHWDEGRETTLALAGDTLVVSHTRPRVVAALRHASDRASVRLDNERLKAILEKLDRKRVIWFAVDMRKIGSPPLPALIEPLLSPVIDEAEALSGGVAWGNEISAEVTFFSRTEAKANRLEVHLQGVRKIADAVARFSRDEYVSVFLQLIVDAKITREGTDIVLTSQIGKE